MSEETTGNIHCPFWSTFALKCRISCEGLFIPLDEHIEMYCTTNEYPLCLQYSMNSDLPEISDQDQGNIDERRMYPRMEANYRVTLVKITETGRLAKHFSLHASTIDISKGGMCLNTSEQLIDDTRIAFSFVDVLPEDLQSGIAKIKWCKKHENSGTYQAGLAFETQPSGAINMYLKMSTSNN